MRPCVPLYERTYSAAASASSATGPPSFSESP